MKKRRNILFIGIALVLVLVLAVVLRYLTPGVNVHVTSQSPSADKRVSIYGPLTLHFDNQVSQAVFESCSFTITPEVPTAQILQGKDITITPTTRFDVQTTYKLLLMCTNLSYQTSFTTVSSSEMSDDDVSQLQIEKDFDFATTTKEMFEKNPWKLKLPIETKMYTVVYSDSTEQYYATATIPQKSKITRTDLEKEIRVKLGEIGAPSAPILWR